MLPEPRIQCTSCGDRPSPPNILLISLDTLRADHLSSYGYSRETSPFLDELAGRGVRFENAFVNTHSTQPSHATLLSGQYQETHRVAFDVVNKTKDTWVNVIPQRIPLIQEILALNGYRTIAVTDGGYVAGNLGFQRGFEEYIENEVRDVRKGAERFVELVRQDSGDERPVFAFFHTYQVHGPYNSPAKYDGLFGDEDQKLIPEGSVPGYINRIITEHVNDSSALTRQEIDLLVTMYDRSIRYTDDSLREMFRALEDIGFLEKCQRPPRRRMREKLVGIGSFGGRVFPRCRSLRSSPGGKIRAVKTQWHNRSCQESLGNKRSNCSKDRI